MSSSSSPTTTSGVLSQYAPYAGDASNALGIYGGLQQGGVKGNTSAAINAGKLATSSPVLGSSDLNQGFGEAGNALGIYSGLERGGVLGYTGAAANATQLAGALMDNPGVGAVGGYIAAPLAVYNAISNYKSGATGSDTLNGAEAGAAVGSIIPGIGTVIGGVVGAAAGALSSAFGPGEKDPETTGVQGLINATSQNQNNPAIAQNVSDPYVALAGLMDNRSSTLPMYQQYGRMGEQKFTNDLATQINDAFTPGQGIQSGPLKGDVWSVDPKTGQYDLQTPTGGNSYYAPQGMSEQIYNSVVDPWVGSMGSGYKNVGSTYANTTQGLLQDMTGEYLSGNAAQDWKAVGGDSPFANIYQNSPFAPATASSSTAAAPTTPTTPQSSPAPVAAPRPITKLAATGGNVNYKDHLQRLLKSMPMAEQQEEPHFDDGGDVSSNDDVSYFEPDYNTISSDYGTPGSAPPANYSTPNLTDPSQSDIWNQSDLDKALNGSGSIVNSSNDSAMGPTSSTGINSLLSSLAPYLKAGAIASPLLAKLLGGSGSGGSSPGTASGYGAPAPIATPDNLRQEVTSPTNNSTGTPMSQQDWYTYGERPEANFFTNNQIPYVSGVSPNSAAPTATATAPAATPAASGAIGQATGAPTVSNTQPIVLPRSTENAEGGAIGQALQPPENQGPGGGRHILGAGNGTSDDIDAKLSDGEYVMDANTVSMLGNGSNKAGAEALDRLRENLRKHAAKPMSKGKQFMKAKPPEAYMAGGRK